MKPPSSADSEPFELQIFARRLREARKEARLSQVRLSELAGLDRSYISDLERGTANPSLLKMAQLARILGKSVADLLRG